MQIITANTLAETFARLNIDIDELQTKCVHSNNFRLYSLFWSVEFCKSGDNVTVELISNLSEEAPLWSCQADANVTLLDTESDEFLTKTITQQTFNSTNPSYRIDDLVSWDMFFLICVHNNKSIVDISISINKPVRNLVSEQFSTKSYIYFENVSKFFDNSSMFSPNIVVRGIKWRVEASKRHPSNDLAVFLVPDSNDFRKSESWKVKASFNLINWNSITQGHSMHLDERFSKTKSWGWDKFLSWDEFINPNNGYIQNDTAKFLVEITVDEPTLD